MKKNEVKKIIFEKLFQIANEKSLCLETIEENHHIINDLGFASIDLATLVAMLEEAFKIDPFMDGDTAITDIRTVGEFCAAYYLRLNR